MIYSTRCGNVLLLLLCLVFWQFSVLFCFVLFSGRCASLCIFIHFLINRKTVERLSWLPHMKYLLLTQQPKTRREKYKKERKRQANLKPFFLASATPLVWLLAKMPCPPVVSFKFVATLCENVIILGFPGYRAWAMRFAFVILGVLLVNVVAFYFYFYLYYYFICARRCPSWRRCRVRWLCHCQRRRFDDLRFALRLLTIKSHAAFLVSIITETKNTRSQTEAQTEKKKEKTQKAKNGKKTGKKQKRSKNSKRKAKTTTHRQTSVAFYLFRHSVFFLLFRAFFS